MQDLIYKYYMGNGYSIDALRNKYLWFSKPPYFNDPFDCSMEHLVTRDSQLSMVGKEFIRQNTKEFGICCFTEDPFSQHMWSFYANGNQGFCVEFDRDVMKSFCSDRFQAKCDLMKCDYRDEPLNLNEPIDWIFHKNGLIESFSLPRILSCDKHTDKLFEMLLLQKNSKIWKKEKEWRIILGGRAIKNGGLVHTPKLKGYQIPLPENAIRSIILGSMMEDPERKKIETINQEVYSGQLEIKEIELDHDTWGLKLKKIGNGKW